MRVPRKSNAHRPKARCVVSRTGRRTRKLNYVVVRRRGRDRQLRVRDRLGTTIDYVRRRGPVESYESFGRVDRAKPKTVVIAYAVRKVKRSP